VVVGVWGYGVADKRGWKVHWSAGRRWVSDTFVFYVVFFFLSFYGLSAGVFVLLGSHVQFLL